MLALLVAAPRRAFAQSDDADPEMRIQQLENQLRQLTGQNEELQYRNRQLEERLRRFRAAHRPIRWPASGPPQVSLRRPSPAAAAPPMQPAPG